MKTAFSAFVFGPYDKFIPYYIFSISKNYPESDIVLFYHGEISVTVKEYVSKFPKVILYDNFYSEFNYFKDYKMRGGGGLTLLRFLIPGHYFKKYEYVYFGDVDILILEEENNLFDFHRAQIKNCNVPFSNKVRKQQDNTLSKRLTGLHFVEVKPYFEKVDSLVNKVLNDKSYQEKIISRVVRDEEFLYVLNKCAFNFDPICLSNNERPWHGFHLGLVRHKNYLDEKTIEENSSISFKEIKAQLEQFNIDENFTLLMRSFYCKEIFFTFRYFSIKLPSRVSILYNIALNKNLIFKFIKRFKN